MRKPNNEKHLKDVLQDLLEVYKLRPKINEAKLVEAWERLMGKTIAKSTSKISLKDEVLYLQIDSSVIKSELSFAKSKIIELVNKELGGTYIKRVEIK